VIICVGRETAGVIGNERIFVTLKRKKLKKERRKNPKNKEREPGQREGKGNERNYNNK
jgi:hypothetical protein